MKTARELIQTELDESDKKYAEAVEAQNWPVVDIYGARSAALSFALQVLALEEACK